MIEITDISLSELKKKFIDFGCSFPKQFPNIIPKFRQSEEALLNNDRNFFYKDGGELQGFLAFEDNKVKGRVAAMINPTIHCENDKLGLLGLFECENRTDISEALITSACSWLKEKQCTLAWGPFDFSMWHNYRFAIDSFNEKPFIGEPRNPEYYPSLFTKSGFAERYEWQSRIIDLDGMQKIMNNFRGQYDLFNELGYEIVKITPGNEKFLMEKGYELFVDTYKVFTGFSKIGKDDFLSLYNYVPMLLDRNASFFVKDPSGDYVAFILVLKDLTQSLMSMNGKTNLLAKIKFKLNENKSELANIYQGGIKISAIREAMKFGKEKLGKPLAVGRAAVYKSLYEISASGKYKYAVFPLMREDAPNRNYSEGIYIKKRTHILYEKRI